MKPRILLIYTGGTIGMMEDPSSGELRPFEFSRLMDQVPELRRFNIQLDCQSFENPIDSSNMSPEIWVTLVSTIESNYDKYEGFVILHGSDTMAYTASALSFMLENLSKPVILTGSQLPIGKIRTDGKENMITAVEIASDYKQGKPCVPEVAVYFEYKLYRGNRTHKFNAEHFQAFQSPNYPVLAEAGVHLKYNEQAIVKHTGEPLKAHKKLASDIVILKLFPGITHAVVRAILSEPYIRAVILETFGAGNGPEKQWLFDEIEAASKCGVVFLNITQCNSGKVEQGRYQASSMFRKLGVVGGGDMTIEAAVTKLMFLLGTGSGVEEIKELLKKNLRGELSI